MHTPYQQMVLNNDGLIPDYTFSNYTRDPFVEEESLPQIGIVVQNSIDRIDLK